MPRGVKTILFDAARDGSLTALQENLPPQSQLINFCDPSTGNTLLHVACINSRLPVVVWLAGQGLLMPNMTNKDGKTAVFAACEQGDLLVLNELLNHLAHSIDT